MGFVEEMGRQPEALERLLVFYREEGRDRLEQARTMVARGLLIFLGMGSSHFAGLYGAALLNRRGVAATALEASGAVTDAPAFLRQAATWVLISQSGESPEVVQLVGWEGRPASVVAITNNTASPLAQGSDVTLPLMAGSEEATTSKTYTNTLALLALLAGREAADLDALPPAMDEVLRMSYDFAGFSSDAVTVVGRGLSLTSAYQTALILREGAHLAAGAYSGGAFRHGPLQWAGPGAEFVIFTGSESYRPLQHQLIGDLRSRGAEVMTIGDDSQDTWRISPPEPELAPILEILPAQRLMVDAAERQGLPPGELTVKVTRQE